MAMDDMTESRENARANSCPICRKPAAEKFRPFCSKRCADVDLHRWLGGVYAIPVTEDADEDGTSREDEEEER
jgi:endogenous inhibitor of DNA gyrase (YacG/DUF329 family)